jgi:hypothetical protein
MSIRTACMVARQWSAVPSTVQPSGCASIDTNNENTTHTHTHTHTHNLPKQAQIILSKPIKSYQAAHLEEKPLILVTCCCCCCLFGCGCHSGCRLLGCCSHQLHGSATRCQLASFAMSLIIVGGAWSDADDAACSDTSCSIIVKTRSITNWP